MGNYFYQNHKGDGVIVFHNEELGLTFPFFWGNGYSENDRNSLANIDVVRVVFPKYVERPRPLTQGVISYDGKNYTYKWPKTSIKSPSKRCTTTC